LKNTFHNEQFISNDYLFTKLINDYSLQTARFIHSAYSPRNNKHMNLNVNQNIANVILIELFLDIYLYALIPTGRGANYMQFICT
jgi:hypothetical protein